MFVRLLLLFLLLSRSLPLSDWNTKLDSLSLVTGDTSYKSTFARVVRLKASCFLADGTSCTATNPCPLPHCLLRQSASQLCRFAPLIWMLVPLTLGPCLPLSTKPIPPSPLPSFLRSSSFIRRRPLTRPPPATRHMDNLSLWNTLSAPLSSRFRPPHRIKVSCLPCRSRRLSNCLAAQVQLVHPPLDLAQQQPRRLVARIVFKAVAQLCLRFSPGKGHLHDLDSAVLFLQQAHANLLASAWPQVDVCALPFATKVDMPELGRGRTLRRSLPLPLL
jgi:hypothetical protein